ncbi:MAG: hypothetical protein AAF936_05880 [Pseudomonadota bacterium]
MKRSIIIATATAAFMGASATAQEDITWADALNAKIEPAWSAPEHRAFDFWIGEWEANWRPPVEGAFKHAEEGSYTRQRVFPILGGKALIELAWARDNPEQPSQRGFSIRYYDPARERWVMAQNWPNENNQGSAFFDQLIGDEHLGRLTMYSITRRPQDDGSFDVQHRRYNFTDIRPGVSFRWDGSNTRDEGATWNTWYVVDFLRLRDPNAYGPAGTPFPGVHEQALCTEEPHGAFNGLQGVWEGTATDANGAVSPARFSAGLALDGCGVLGSLELEDKTAFLALGLFERLGKWLTYYLDDRPGTTHTYYVADKAGEGAVFRNAPALTIKDEFAPYNLEEYFEPADSTRRIVWEMISETALAFREETRIGVNDEWAVTTTYRLMR